MEIESPWTATPPPHMSPIGSTRSVRYYPITPASTMAELADAWASQGTTNIWGRIPIVQEMQAKAVRPACSTERCSPAH